MAIEDMLSLVYGDSRKAPQCEMAMNEWMND